MWSWGYNAIIINGKRLYRVLTSIYQLYKFGTINIGWSWEGVHATSCLLPSGKKPPLWDNLITGKEGMVIRGETGG